MVNPNLLIQDELEARRCFRGFSESRSTFLRCFKELEANITLVWGTLFLLGLAVVALGAAGRERRRVARRLAVVAGLFAIGVGIDLWFLLIAARLHGERLLCRSSG